MSHETPYQKTLESIVKGLIGGTLGRYRIVRELGRGGMAVVYEAESDGQRFAIKVLPASLLTDRLAIDRFDREAKTQASLKHPGIIRVFETGTDREFHYFVMELIDGKTLEALLLEKGRLPSAEALSIAEKVAVALAHAHEHKVIHRDIKPGNILLSEENRVTVTDFGLVRLTEAPRLTQTGQVMGTPLYMSPEQARGERVDERSDLFSLGVVLYEMVTGRTPFEADSNLKIIRNVIEEEVRRPKVLVPELSLECEYLILKLLRKRREDRYHSAAQLLDDLGKLKNGIALRIPEAPGGIPIAVAETDLPKLARELLTQQDVATKVLTMFPPRHPQALQSLSKYFAILNALLASRDTVTFGASDGHLVIEGVLLDEKDGRSQQMVRNLLQWKIHSITFRRGLTLEELENFLRILVAKKESLPQAGTLARCLKEQSVRSIQVDELRFEKVTRKGKGLSPYGGEGKDFIETILAGYLKGRLGPVQTKEDLLKVVTENPQAVAAFLEKAGGETPQQNGSFVHAGLQNLARQFHDFGEKDWKVFREHLAELILALTPELRSQVLEEALLAKLEGGEDALIEEAMEEFSDEAVLELFRHELSQKRGVRLRQLVVKFFEDPARRQRLRAPLEELLTSSGLSQGQVRWILQDKSWTQLSVLEKETELISQDYPLFLWMGICEHLLPLLQDLLAFDRSESVRKVLLELWRGLEDSSADERLRIAEAASQLIDFLFEAEAQYLLYEALERFLGGLSKEKDPSVARTLAQLLDGILNRLMKEERFEYAVKILKVLQEKSAVTDRLQEGVLKVARHEVVVRLIEGLASPSKKGGSSLEELLAALGDASLQPLIQFVTDSRLLKRDPLELFQLKKRLVFIFQKIPAASQKIMEQLSSIKEESVLMSALELLREIGVGEDAEGILFPLYHEDPNVRRAAILALEGASSETALSLLVGALGRETGALREVALGVLRHFKTKEAEAVSVLSSLIPVRGSAGSSSWEQTFWELVSRTDGLAESIWQDFQRERQSGPVSLGQFLVTHGRMDPERLTQCCALFYGFRYLPRERLRTSPQILHLVPLTYAKEHGAFPVQRYGDLLVTAFAWPEVSRIKALEMMTNCRVAPALASADAIRKAIAFSYGILSQELPNWGQDATHLLVPQGSPHGRI